MLRLVHPLLFLSGFFGLAGLYLFADPAWQRLAPLSAALGFAAVMGGTKKQATDPQLVGVWLSGILTALLLFFSSFFSPLLGVAALLATAAAGLRFSFFNTFTQTRFIGLEMGLAAGALLCYLLGNLPGASGWQGWVAPLPLLLFGLMFGALGWVDGKSSLRHNAHGYGVELGRPAPEFELPNLQGNLVRLSDYRGRNVLLVFVRGDWCPSCHVTLRAYERRREEFQKRGVVILAIGPDPVGVNRQMVEKLGVEYEVLSDEGQKVSGAYGVQDPEGKGPYQEGVPLPASFLINTVGAVCYTSRPDRVGEFLNPNTIFDSLEKL